MRNFLLSDLLHLVYPNLCVMCIQQLGRAEQHICLRCESELPLYEEAVMEKHPMARALWGRIQTDWTWAWLSFRKGSPAQKLLHEIKYRNNQDLGYFMGKLMGKAIKEDPRVPKFDMLIPVPLHPKKLVLRGYNQSDLLAKGVAEILQIPYRSDLLVRSGKSATQTTKNRAERWSNVSQDFSLSLEGMKHIESKRILLIDDVFTTGATSEACLRAIVEGKPSAIGVACLAYAR